MPSIAGSNVTTVSSSIGFLWLTDSWSYSHLVVVGQRGKGGVQGDLDSGVGIANTYPARTNILITVLDGSMGTICHSNLHGPQYTAVGMRCYLLELCQPSLCGLHLSLQFIIIITGVILKESLSSMSLLNQTSTGASN